MGYNLLIKSAWRSPAQQRRIYKKIFKIYKKEDPNRPYNILRKMTNKFVHPPDVKTPPPHCAGAAIDLTITDPNHKQLDMTSPFKRFRGIWTYEAIMHTHCVGLSNRALKNRKLLIRVMSKAGFTNYPSEWWHWYYGDSGWAWRLYKSYAIYGLIEK